MTALTRRRVALCLTLVLVPYTLGYALARAAHRVIHRTGYATVAGERVLRTHFVHAGEPHRANDAIALLFAPCRAAEWAAWHVVQPVGSPWP